MFHANTEKSGVDVYVQTEEDMKNVPHCPHGPMLLFERFFQDQASRKFYACSACRDRKQCSFFQWIDEKISATRQIIHKEIISDSKAKFSHDEFMKRLEKVTSLPRDKDRQYCHDCKLLLLPQEKEGHKNHNLQLSLSIEKLSKPTEWLQPLENRKFNAQYLFSSKSTQFMIDQFKRLEVKNVICIGTPRLHEAVQLRKQSEKAEMNSLLLDIDSRFLQFFSSCHFCHYNMFNHYFFDGDASKNTFIDFITGSGNVAMVIDPPFGGLASVLAETIKKIWKIHKSQGQDRKNILVTFLVFPYFLESHVTEALPSLHMMDYKVDYDNHPLYKKAIRNNKRDSPVRIYTNIVPKDFVLPTDDGYRYCELCQRYVANANKHCTKCKSCPSKDGRTYIHCDQCKRCVKPGRAHCNLCNRCELPNHSCTGVKKDIGCHICGEFGHKRKDCPQREGVQHQNKQEASMSTSDIKRGQKRKTSEGMKMKKKLRKK